MESDDLKLIQNLFIEKLNKLSKNTETFDTLKFFDKQTNTLTETIHKVVQ
jgi:hypothetical protein